MTNQPPRTQLCLQFSALGDTGRSLNRLSLALRLAPFSSVIFATDPGQVLDAATVHPLVELAQAQGVAALIHGDAALARALRADGVHVPWGNTIAAAYGEAREILGGRFIVGADAGRSRHDAMALAEAGSDYIGFGIPPHVEDRVSAAERRLDLTAWWAEIFEVPVMALDVETAEDVAMLSAVRSDFVGLRVSSALSDADYEQKLTALTLARAAPVSTSAVAM